MLKIVYQCFNPHQADPTKVNGDNSGNLILSRFLLLTGKNSTKIDES